MHATLLLCAGALLQQTVVASIGLPVHRSLSLRQDDGGDDGGDDGDNPNYFEQVCFPDFNDDSDTLTVSTPCEALELLEFECQANGSATIDYIAQQQCICGSDSFFDMFSGCNNCMKVHGGTENSDWFDASFISSVSSSFCSGTPTTDFDDLFGNMMETLVPASVTGTDLFPSQTAVSNYFTAAIETNPGAITGSATRATAASGSGVFSSDGPEDTGSDFFPTATSGSASAHITGSTTGSSSTSKTSSSSKTSGSSKASSSSSTSTSSGASASATGNTAADLKIMSGMIGVVAAGMGVVLAF